MQIRNKLRTAAVVAAVAGLSVSLAACGGGSGSGQSGSSSSGKGETFTVWHYEADNTAAAQAWSKAIEIFQDEHPDVDVVFEMQSFEQLQKNAKIVLTGDDVPDIMEFNKGNSTAGQLAAQGLIMNLDEYAEAQSWDEKLSPSIYATALYDEQGLMGSGNWYGVPNYGEFVMVYYNGDMFEEQGIELPTTYADLTAAMDEFVAAGVTPLAMGGAEYPFQHLWYELVLRDADQAFVDDYQFFANPVDWTGGPVLSGSDMAAEWIEKGYIGKDTAGITAEDMGLSFINQTYPMMYSGSWWFGRLTEEMDTQNWGVLPFPDSSLHPGSSGNLWVIPTNAKNPDLAAEFIEVTLRPEVQQLFAEKGGLPAVVGDYTYPNEKVEAFTDTFMSIVAEDGLAFYPDWPVPGFYDVLVSEGQSLINGSKTPAEMAAGIGAAYDEGKEDLLSQ